MNITFRKDAKLKTGLVINAGVRATGKFVKVIGGVTGTEYDAIEVTIPEGTEVSAGNVLDANLTFKTRKFSTFFKPPTMKTLEKYSLDSVAKSVTGKRCEPDGHSDDNAPSWLLVLGMI
jgi:hypothetical protein